MHLFILPVALNFQTPGEQMDLNQGRFTPNGLCGYVLKPSFMCQPDCNFNPYNTGGGPGHNPIHLTIQVNGNNTHTHLQFIHSAVAFLHSKEAEVHKSTGYQWLMSKYGPTFASTTIASSQLQHYTTLIIGQYNNNISTSQMKTC